MSSMPVSQAALCDKLRQAILEAARCQVPVGTIIAALEQAREEVRAAAPLVVAYAESARGMTANAKSEPTARLFAQVGSTDGLGG